VTVKKYRDLTPDAEEGEHDQVLRTLESALRLEKRADCVAAEPPDRDCGDAEAEAAWALKPQDPTQYNRFMQIWIAKAVVEQDPAKREEYLRRTETAATTWLPSATGAEAVRAKAILGNVYLRQKRYDEAQATLEEVKKADPTFCGVQFDLARVQLGKGDFNAAKAVATEAIACAPDDPQGYLLRATAEYGLDDCPSVVKDGAEFAKRAAGKASPKFVSYCKNVMDWEKSEKDRQKRVDEYKKWLMQQIEYGDEEDRQDESPPKKK
jgi:tetratricopeptide (TPR) repeat protein